jgi:hypothetical protein
VEAPADQGRETLARCVVLSGGHGRPISFADDEPIGSPQSAAGYELALVWGCDRVASLDADAPEAARSVSQFFPEGVGSRFYLQTLPAGYGVDPGRALEVDYDSVKAEVAQTPTLSATMYTANGFHFTNTVDCGVIISGSVWLIAPGGEERELGAGDSFVDIGAPHAWENRSTEPCTFALFIVGATPRTPAPGS